MKKLVKLVAGNGVFAALAICLYSPGLVGLSPFSSNAVIAAASIAVGVVALPLFVWMNRHFLIEREPVLLQAGEDQAGEKAAELMEAYRSSKVLGGIARSALSQMHRLKNARVNYEKLVARRFEAGTMSYQKFMGVVHSAEESLSGEYVKMANKMIIFDEGEYRHLSSDAYRYDDIPDQVQEEKRKLYEENLAGMRSILEKNETILLKIDHLMMEMSDLDYSEHEIDHAAAQINDLLKQLEYYK